MTTDVYSMQSMATEHGRTPTAAPMDMPDAWPSGGSTASLNIDDDEHGDPEVDDGDGSGSSSRKYERKTRRFAWPDDLHRLFVAAIFDLGLKNASPKALMPFMEPTATSAGLTTEHLKSHLQKYRQNYDKSRSEFLAFFDESAKKNGRRRRRTAKCMESHTRFIFPITPCPQGDSVSAGLPAPSATMDLKIDPTTMDRVDASPQPPYCAPHAYGQLTPRTRFDRANLLRLAQQNAAVAFAAQSAGGCYGVSMHDTPPGVEGVTDAQWGMLASLLSPQVAAVNATGGEGSMPAAFSLSQDASPDMQLQMHLAMQAQMNLHRQMLSRKVAVSQHYYNQAAAVKRAAASAMVERALQNHAATNSQKQQQQPQSMTMGGRYHDPSMAAPGDPSRPSLNDAGMMQQQQHRRQQTLMDQQQRFITPMEADALLGPPWEAMDIDMNIQSDDPSDLFGFLKSSE